MGFLPLLLAGAAIVIVLTRKSDALPEPAEIPTVSDIQAAVNMPLLDYYYEVINAALFEDVITRNEYSELYAAYEQRWWELTGA